MRLRSRSGASLSCWALPVLPVGTWRRVR
ncbi:GlyGly-CTERM sorting domain-containing protein [uncultured Pseudoteredinibacter sp.]